MKRLIALAAVLAAITTPAAALAGTSPHSCHNAYGTMSASYATSCPFAATAARQWIVLGQYAARQVTRFSTWSPVTDETYPFTCRTRYSWRGDGFGRHWAVACVAGPPARGPVWVAFWSRER